MKKLTNAEVHDIEEKTSIKLPGLFHKLLVELGYGQLSERMEIYHPLRVPHSLITDSEMIVFGQNKSQKSFFVIDSRKELVADILAKDISNLQEVHNWLEYSDWLCCHQNDFLSKKVESKRTSIKALTQKYGNDIEIIDLTSKSDEPWAAKFSPFYPHGGIPVPFSKNTTGESVEGIWQALKVFESSDVDLTKLSIKNMKGLKRTVKKFGKVLGHREGVQGNRLLPYIEARIKIYLPCYRWVLENRLQAELDELRDLCISNEVILLDYEKNCDVFDESRPLSHAGLVRAFLLDEWPS